MAPVAVAIAAVGTPHGALAQAKQCSILRQPDGSDYSPNCNQPELDQWVAQQRQSGQPLLDDQGERAMPPPKQEAASAPAPSFPPIIPHFGQGLAGATEVARVVGHSRVTFESCPTSFNFGDHRRVQVHVGRGLQQSLFETPSVADALLAKAAHAAWKKCPQPFTDARTDFHYNIESVQILDADDSVALSATLGSPGIASNSDDLFNSAHDGYAWTDLSDHYTPYQQRVAQVSQPSAPDGSIPVVDPETRRLSQIKSAEFNKSVDEFFASVWRIVKLIAGAMMAIWLFKRREAIAEWYYALKPHPASGQVDGTINNGLPIDGKLFAKVNQPFDGNKYEIKVRNQQAGVLTQRLRRHEEALRSGSEAILRKKREELLREQEFMRAHEALINAGVDHEMAAAHLAALRKATGQ